VNPPVVAKPWIASTAAGVMAAVERLKQESPEALFVLLTRAAAAGEWDTFVPALERVSGVKGIKLLLPAPDGFPMRYAYESAGMPAEYWPVFVAVLEVAARVAADAGRQTAGKILQKLVFDRALNADSVRDLACLGRVTALLTADSATRP
jgi:hypothetical protein